MLIKKEEFYIFTQAIHINKISV